MKIAIILPEGRIDLLAVSIYYKLHSTHCLLYGIRGHLEWNSKEIVNTLHFYRFNFFFAIRNQTKENAVDSFPELKCEMKFLEFSR